MPVVLLRTKYIKIEPAAAAIIMAFGIFFIGAMEYFPAVDTRIGKIGAYLLILIWIIIYSLLSWQFFQRDFFRAYIGHPVQTFTIGTWIAGVSVLCTVLLKYFPQASAIIALMALLNMSLWCLFFILCIRNFIVLMKQRYPVDGVLLLSTVGIQSIVISLNELYSFIPESISMSIIIIGIVFYLISFFYIIRYYHKNKWTLKDNWANTNCIIHGALSITGLAWLTVFPQTSAFVQAFWWVTFMLVIIIEMIEVVRMISRVRYYGIGHGLGKYHVSQWSRNFTFGMFFAFTWAYVNVFPTEMITWQQGVLAIWVWFVVIFLFIETCLFLLAKGSLLVKKM